MTYEVNWITTAARWNQHLTALTVTVGTIEFKTSSVVVKKKKAIFVTLGNSNRKELSAIYLVLQF